MNFFSTLHICKVLLLLLSSFFMGSFIASAAELHWEALPDRERLTLTRSEIEGLPGNIARISSKGILIPFTEVPKGLNGITTPEGAALFNGTRQLGRALAIRLQTPEFGFVVTSKEPEKIVLDLFKDPLGARWKRSGLPPMTDVAPNYAIDFDKLNATSPDLTAPHVTWGNADAPFAKSSTPLEPLENPNAPVVTTSGDVVSEKESPLPSSSRSNATQAPETSTPQNSSSLPDLPQQASSQARNQPQESNPLGSQNSTDVKAEFSTQISPVGGIVVPEMENRVAKLPDLAPNSNSSVPIAPKTLPPAIKETSSPLQAMAAPPAPIKISPPATKNATSAKSASPSVNKGITETKNATTASTSKRKLPSVLPGVGIRVNDVTYRGQINPEGVQAIPFVTEDELISLFPLSSGGDKAQQNSTVAMSEKPNEKATESKESATDTGEASDKSEVGDKEEKKDKAGEEASEPSEGSSGEGTPEPEYVYLDENGNPLPAPVDPTEYLKEINSDREHGLFADALEKLNRLLDQQKLSAEQTSGDNVPNPFIKMTPEQLEVAYHLKSEALFMVNKDNLQNTYKEVTDAIRQAISYNPASERNADALLRLGYVNLRMSNLPEAEAYFGQFRRQFPDNKNVPLTYYYWGDYYYNRGEYERAANQFQKIMDLYPSSNYVKEAALGYARSNYRMGYYQDAFDTIKFIESKWRWFYLDYPPFLNMVGDIAYRLGDLDYALQRYWTYVNIAPKGDETDVILTRIGDIYELQHQSFAATEIYKSAVKRFPDKDGGLVARMRLAERRINDDPNISNMYDIFEDKKTLSPEEDYKSIIENYPNSSLVPLAELKLAMWYLWRHEYLRTLDTASQFMKKYANHELAPKMKELALKTFAILSAESVADGSYGRMKSVWEQYPILQGQEEILTPESRIALGVGYWKDGKPDDALIAIEPFFLGSKIPKFSEMALNLALTIYLEYNEWDAIQEVDRRVQLWQLDDNAQKQLDYAMALSLENTDQAQRAESLWAKLYKRQDLPNDQMAYAAFYLAKDAQDNKKYDDAYLYGVDALKRLKEAAEQTPEQADNGKIMSQLSMLKTLTENGGRLAEALGYAQEYLGMLPDTDQESKASTLYQIARIKKDQGDETAWRAGLESIAQQYPNSIWGQKASSDLNLARLARDEKKFSGMGQ